MFLNHVEIRVIDFKFSFFLLGFNMLKIRTKGGMLVAFSNFEVFGLNVAIYRYLDLMLQFISGLT